MTTNITRKQVDSDLDSDDLEFEPFDYDDEPTVEPKYACDYIIAALGILDHSALEQSVSKTETLQRQLAALAAIPRLAVTNVHQSREISHELTRAIVHVQLQLDDAIVG